MRAGRLRNKITIQNLVETRDAKGSVSEDWITFSTDYASIEPLNGKEYFDSEKVNAEVTARIRLRYRSDVTPKMRILFGSRVFHIISPPIDVFERGREMVLMCKEVV